MPARPDPAAARRVTIFDYGAGNLHSLVKAVTAVPGTGGADRVRPVWAMLETDLLILPGVGAFSPAAARLAPARAAVRDALAGGLPCLGICLGMQLLFEGSDEGPGAGIGLLPGASHPAARRAAPPHRLEHLNRSDRSAAGR